MQARYPYLYTSPELLTLREVGGLLTAYKELALKYEALALVSECDDRSSVCYVWLRCHQGDQRAPAWCVKHAADFVADALWLGVLTVSDLGRLCRLLTN